MDDLLEGRIESMEALKVKKKISSKDLHIEELEKFIGQDAEIIILTNSSKKPLSFDKLMKLAGTIKSGEDPLIFQKKMRNEWGATV